MSFVRDVIDGALRALGTEAPPTQLGKLEQTVMQSLRASYAGCTVRLYVPRVGTAERAARARAILALWDGSNAAALASQFGLSERRVLQIVSGKPKKSSD